MFYTEETYEDCLQYPLDYVIDASDTIIYKIHLIKQCLQRGIPIISSMGAANKMDPTRFQVADISKTTMDPIARVIRQKLRKDGITQRRQSRLLDGNAGEAAGRRDAAHRAGECAGNSQSAEPPASIAFVPPVAGLIMASVAVRDILGKHGVVRADDCRARGRMARSTNAPACAV